MDISTTEIRPAVEARNDADGRPLVIAGPCSAESRDQLTETAMQLRETGITAFRAGIWKPRTKPGCFEGVGEQGLEWLAEAKRLTGLPTATEVATPAHVEAAVESGIDILWIGARTTVNPFAVQELADALAAADPEGRIGVIVKNPVSPDLELWDGAIQRFLRAGRRRISATLRGFTSLGESIYRNTPHWSIATELRLRYPSLQLLCDPSHIGGRRELIAPLSQTALDLGFDGLMIEAHRNPQQALSDAAQQLTPTELTSLLDKLRPRRHTSTDSDNRLSKLRERIDAADAELLDALRLRMEISREIGEYKKESRMAVVQPGRYNEMMEHRLKTAATMGLDPDFISHLFYAIHHESIKRQL